MTEVNEKATDKAHPQHNQHQINTHTTTSQHNQHQITHTTTNITPH